jgi:thiamine kinase-like enzyme
MINLLKTHPFFNSKQIESCDLLENQGYCNENYMVVADGVNYIVRKLLRDDIDRAFEWKVQKLVFEKNITAEPLVFDEENAFMLFAFLEGEHKTTVSSDELKHLAQTLQKLHSISIDAKPIELQTDTSTVECYPQEYVLCHNDLNSQNIFFSTDIKFIDWEYAGVNDRYFDLACVCVEFGLDGEMVEVFLEAYFKGENFSFEKLEAYKMIYMALCEEWFQNML